MKEVVEYNPDDCKDFNIYPVSNKYLDISGIRIHRPFKTIIPFFSSSGVVSKLESVMKNERIKFDESSTDPFTEVSDIQAISLSVKLIGFSLKEGNGRRHKKTILRYFSNPFSLSTNNDDINPLLGFRLSDHLELNEEVDQTAFDKDIDQPAFIDLLEFKPNLIFTDSVVKMSIGLLCDMCFRDINVFANRARKLLKDSGLKLFVPIIMSKKKTHDRAILEFVYRPEKFYLLVKLYELIIDDFFKVNKNTRKSRIDMIEEAFKYIYESDMPEDLFDYDESAKDLTSIALNFISQECNSLYEGLYKRYYSLFAKKKFDWKDLFYKTFPKYKDNKKCGEITHTYLPYYLKDLRKTLPDYLSEWIDKMDKELSNI